MTNCQTREFSSYSDFGGDRAYPQARRGLKSPSNSESRLKPTKNPDSTVTNFSPLQRTSAMRQGFQSLSDCRTHTSSPINQSSRSGLPEDPPGIEIPVS
ncbi:hypothetical protein [Microcoleus sp. T2B6]|uniref:hypothetical protein n=1 Tax=Microcoleus sp. T2B6 TaxID=3055424 RepID=UPI002FD71999